MNHGGASSAGSRRGGAPSRRPAEVDGQRSPKDQQDGYEAIAAAFEGVLPG